MFTLVNMSCLAPCCRSSSGLHPVPVVLDTVIGAALLLIAFQVVQVKVDPALLEYHRLHILPLAGFSCAPMIFLIGSVFGNCLGKCCRSHNEENSAPQNRYIAIN